jgi:hypothetical protein
MSSSNNKFHDVARLLILVATTTTTLTATFDAAAVPFFGHHARGTQATAQSEDAAALGLMTGYTSDVQSGLGDFAFLARNFAGGNAGTAGRPPVGLIGPAATPIGVDTPAAPVPGSAALLTLGGLALLWSRRTTR